MSEIAITVPREYGYVIIATTGTFILGLWQGFRIPAFRKPAKMRYPKAYADSYDLANAENEDQRHAMYLFNCAQRAHHNYLENAPFFAIASLIAGLKYPLSVAILSGLWSLSRIIYAVGYTRADKNDGSGRMPGSGWALCQLAVLILSGMTGYALLA